MKKRNKMKCECGRNITLRNNKSFTKCKCGRLWGNYFTIEETANKESEVRK